MAGNVSEWCQDRFGEYPLEQTKDPQGAANGVGRVLRSGSWRSRARYCRSAERSWSEPVRREDDPQIVFDRMFRGLASGERAARTRSILDAVQADARSLRRSASSADGQTLDAYFDAVRNVERTIASASRSILALPWRRLARSHIFAFANTVNPDIFANAIITVASNRRK